MMLVLSLFFNNNTMSGATSRLGTDTHPEHTRKPSVFCGSCCSIFSFLHCVFWIIVCLLVLFPLAIVLSVLHRFTASDYPLVSWSLYCLSCDLRLLTTLWYLLTFLLSRLRWWETMTDSTHRLKAHLTV